MATDFYNLLLSDSVLALVLLGLFWYVSRISRGLRGIATWGIAHLVYTLGASMLDGTAQHLARTGDLANSQWTSLLGGLLACGGLAGLAWSVILFVRQRALNAPELLLMPLCLSLPLIAWAGWGTLGAQGAAMSAAEVIVMVLIIVHLGRLDTRPDRVPARLMMAGCLVLGGLYARDLWLALGGAYTNNAEWVNIDLSTWYLLNFCMLMLSSFRAAEPLRQGAMFDPLTRALNRRGLDAELAALRHGPSGGVAVLAVDLDHFKAINDAYGHAVGDLVLQHFADIVHASIRTQDIFARVGGEEFMLVLRGLSPADVLGLAERIRQRVEALVVEAGDRRVRVTCSLGVAHAQDDTRTAELRLLADEALYAAKREGRNRVRLSGPTQGPRVH